jgi:hypothetical protein
MTHFVPTEAQPTQYGQSRQEREDTVLCLREHRASWVVLQRECNHSAFNGYRYTPSAWSDVQCTACGRRWRTRAAYVRTLPDQERKAS